MEQSEKNYLKTELLNDLVSVATVMEEIYKYHPENPEKVDIVQEYANLKVIKKNIETELEELKN
tara:strand:- start:1047 stop:1238 length:192 start_codon:yes stop_codon:yes gene_type:complete